MTEVEKILLEYKTKPISTLSVEGRFYSIDEAKLQLKKLVEKCKTVDEVAKLFE